MCVELTSGAALLSGWSPNAHSQAGPFIEAAWKALKRSLLGFRVWPDGFLADAEMETGVRTFMGSIVMKGRRRQLGGAAIGLFSAVGSSRANMAVRSRGPDVTLVPEQMWPIRSPPRGPDAPWYLTPLRCGICSSPQVE